MKALTLNDFRSVIGTNNYGEVRLSNEGGLEKINTHFLQRWGIGRTKPDRAENFMIRQMFADAIQKSGIPQETISRLLGKLGIGKDLTATSDLAGQVLKRADIKSIIADLDAAKITRDLYDMKGMDGVMGHAMRLKFYNQGAAWLEEQINSYNATRKADGDKINLNSAEIKIMCDRYRADIADLLSKVKDSNVTGTATETMTDAMTVAMTQLKAFIADKNIKEGVSKFSGKASAERGNVSKVVDSGYFNPRVVPLRQGLHVKPNHSINFLSNDAEFRHLTLTKDDFDEFPIYNSQFDDDKYLATDLTTDFMDKYREKLSNFTNDEKKCVKYVCDNAQNFVRNPIVVTFGTDIKLDFVELAKKFQENVAKFQEKIVDFIVSVKEKHPNMPFEQFLGVCKVFNQSYYNTPMFFGMTGFFGESKPKFDIQYHAGTGPLTITGTFQKDQKYLVDFYKGRGQDEQTAVATANDIPSQFRTSLTVASDGTAQYQFVGEVKGV